MTGPLQGIVVLDLTRLLPGPFATQLLVDLGATVVKIEDPQGGDYLRWTPPLLHDGTSVIFHAINRGKQSVALDLKSADGKAALLRLCARADVVVESFRPGVMDKLGLSPASLRAAHPRLVVCSISGYGQQGPLRLRAGHDVNYLAIAGALGMMQAPTLFGVQVADLAGGALPAALQICAALYGREKTGQGASLDVSMTHAVASLLTPSLARASAKEAGDDEPLGGGHDLLVGRVPCYGVYRTKDGFLSVGALEPKFWQGFCAATGLVDLVERGLDHGAAGDEVRARVQALLVQRTTAEWEQLFAAHDVCVEGVRTPERALAEVATTIDVDIAGQRVRLPVPVFGYQGAVPCAIAASPLGADNARWLD